MKKRLGIRITTGICAALGWWGLLYPELALTPDTVTVRTKNESGVLQEQPLEWEYDSTLYRDLMNAGPDEIIFRSRLFQGFSLLLEAFQNGEKQ